jgi:hypothetical protein
MVKLELWDEGALQVLYVLCVLYVLYALYLYESALQDTIIGGCTVDLEMVNRVRTMVKPRWYPVDSGGRLQVQCIANA